MSEIPGEILPITGWRVNPENGLIRSLHTKSQDFIISTAGCEIGNWLGFFSQDKLAGVECSINNHSIVVEEMKLVSRFDISLPHARFALELKDSIEQGIWCRHYSATALEPSWLGDFVIRLGASFKVWQTAGSESKRSHHRGWNRYLQYPVERVLLEAPPLMLRTNIEASNNLGRLATVSYWRDEPTGNWIVHHRQLVQKKDLDYVVGRFRFVTKNSADSRWLRLPFIWRPIWALNERRVSRTPLLKVPTFQTQGVINMTEGESVSMIARVCIYANG